MRLDNPDWCFVLGLAEGEFPKAPGDKGLLTHAERESLMRQGVEMPDCFENRAIREQVCFYKALTAPAKGLWLSWAAGSAAMPVTSALAPVIECFSPKEPALERADMAATPAMALDLLGQSWDAESGETAALFQSLAEYRDEAEQGKLLNPVKQAAGAEPFAVHNTAAMKQLLGRELWLTPSRMERYYSCPFAYFLEYVLGAKPRKQAALTADQSGNLVHYILEQALRRAGEGFVDLSEEQVKALAAAIAEEYVQENMPGQARRFSYLVERLKKSAANLLLYIQAEQRQGSFVPVAFEKGIGTSPEDVPPVVLTTSTGETVRMVGKIDRVDAFEKNGNTWLRVVDYKTGSKEFTGGREKRPQLPDAGLPVHPHPQRRAAVCRPGPGGRALPDGRPGPHPGQPPAGGQGPGIQGGGPGGGRICRDRRHGPGAQGPVRALQVRQGRHPEARPGSGQSGDSGRTSAGAGRPGGPDGRAALRRAGGCRAHRPRQTERDKLQIL